MELFIWSDSFVSVQGFSPSAPGWVPSSPVLTARVLSPSTFIRKCISDGSTRTHGHAPCSFPFMGLKCKSETHRSSDIVNNCGSDGCSGTHRSVLSLSLEFLQDRCPHAVTLTDMGPNGWLSPPICEESAAARSPVDLKEVFAHRPGCFTIYFIFHGRK